MTASSAFVDEAYVTLATNDAYVVGAVTLAHSIRQTGSTRHVTCLVTQEVTQQRLDQLEDVFDHVVHVEAMDSGDEERLALLRRPELGITFTKIHAWRLTQYKKCVFLDADALVLQNIDELFERPSFAAAPDVGWPDCFNSGVFVFVPSLETFNNLCGLAKQEGSFDGGDQGLLNTYFDSWSTTSDARLPFTYNMTITASYGYAPAYQRFKRDVKVVHFIGQAKPWHGVPAPSGDNSILVEHVQKWWNVYEDYLRCCSETAPYRTVVGVRPTRSPGPDAEVAPPIETLTSPREFSPSRHDVPKPPEEFLQSGAADDIVSRISEQIKQATTDES